MGRFKQRKADKRSLAKVKRCLLIGYKNWLIYMRNLKPKPNYQMLIGISLSINLLSIIIIFFMAYKYHQRGRTANKDPNNIDTSNDQIETENVNQPNQQTILQNSQTEKGQTQQQVERLKIAFGRQLKQRDQTIAALEHKLEQISKKCYEKVGIQNQLKHELDLEQQRSRFLEEKTTKLEKQLTALRQDQLDSPSFSAITIKRAEKSIPQTQILLNLKNQLQFCQKRLLVSQNTQKQLRLKLQSYQKIGEYSLNHPEYLRMRQMNTRYKQIIASLQSYLLQKNHNIANLNISFKDI